MYISDIIRRSGRSLRQAKARTLLTAAAIAVGTFALTLTLAASNGAEHFVNQIISSNFDPAELIVAKDEALFGRQDTSKPREYDSSYGSFMSNAGATTQIKQLNDKDLAKIADIDGVENVRPAVDVNLQYITRQGQKKYIGTIQALNPAQSPEVLAGQIPATMKGGKIILPEAYVDALGFKNAKDAIGKQVIIAVRKPYDPQQAQEALRTGVTAEQLQKASQDDVIQKKYTVTAVTKKSTVSQPGTELYMYVGQQDAVALNDIANKNTPNYRKYTYAYVRVKDGSDKTKLTAVQNKIKEIKYYAQSVEDTQKFLTQIISVLRAIVAAFGAIAVIASVFGIINTMYISVLQRTREIGLMKALGMHKKDIGRLFRFEAAWIGFLGGLIGSLIAFAVGTGLNPWITKTLDLGEGNKLLIFEFPQIVGLILVLMIVATLAGLFPSRKAAKLDPIEALRTE